MTSLAEVFVQVSPDTKQFPGDLKRDLGKVDVSKAGQKAGDGYASGFGRATKRLAALAGAALVSAKVTSGIKSSIKSASDLAETQSKVGVIFGKSATDIQKFASTAETSLGQTQQAALDANATFGIFGKGAGLTGAKLTGFTTKMTTLASDMASFSNTTPEQAIEAIGAAMRGEAEPIRAYGVLLDDATLKAEAMAMGIMKPTKNLDQIKAAQSRAIVAQMNYNKAVKEHGKDSIEALRAQSSLGAATTTLAKKTQGTVGPLTAQQKVLAAQSSIMKQTTASQGDFARTAGGLANQQRIAAAQTTKLKTAIGTALLPVVVAATTAINKHLLPPLIALAQKHGPAVAKKLTELSAAAVPFVKEFLEKAGPWLAKVSQGFKDVGSGTSEASPALLSLANSAGKLGPFVADLIEKTPKLSSVLRVGAVVFKFLADNVDVLRKAMPFLVGGMIAYQVAQLAANVATLIGIPVKFAEVIVNRQLVKSNRELIAARGVLTVTQAAGTVTTAASTTATAASTTATNAGVLATVRQRVAAIASSVATKAVAVATAVWTAAQWLLNVALTANPVGLIVLGIAALIGVIILIATKTTWFQTIWRVAWGAIKAAAEFAFNWVKKNWPLILVILTGPIGLAVLAIVKHWDTIKSTAGTLWTGIKEIFRTGAAFAWRIMSGFFLDIITGAAKIFGWVPGVGDKLKSAADSFGKFRDDVNAKLLGINDQEIKVGIQYTSKGINLSAPSSVGRGMATGGKIRGRGTPTSDNVPIMASPTEWVIKGKSSRKYGDYAMQSVNDGTAAIFPNARGFAAGGRPGVTVRPSAPPSSLLAKEVAAHALTLAKPYIERGAKQLATPDGPPGPPGAAQQFRGVRLNARTIRMLLSAERILGAIFHITQGSYSTRVAASGGTHAGGGAMDTNGPRGWNVAVTALRRAGFAAWHRTPSQGPWGHHIHSIAMGDTSASRAAKNQMAAYKRGGDGLGHGMALGGKVGQFRGIQRYDMGGAWPSGTLGVNTSGRTETVIPGGGSLDLSDASIRAMAKAFAGALSTGKFTLINRGGAYVLQMSNG